VEIKVENNLKQLHIQINTKRYKTINTEKGSPQQKIFLVFGAIAANKHLITITG